MQVVKSLTGRDVTPSKLLHSSMSTCRTDTKVKIPDRFQQFGNGQIRVTPLESLISLKRKDDPQILCFHAVVKESIIADFLKSRWKHIHQKTADKFDIAEGDRTFWISRFFASC